MEESNSHDPLPAVSSREARLMAILQSMATPHQNRPETETSYVVQLPLEEGFDAIEELEKKALVIFFPCSTPSANILRQWMKLEWSGKLGITVEFVWNVRRFHFIFGLNSEESRDALLQLKTCNFRGHPGVMMPWTPAAEEDTFLPSAIPVWVELPGLPSIFLSTLNSIFGALGPVVAIPSSALELSRGCILWDLAKPIPPYITVKLGNIIYEQPAVFYNVPGCCFRCKGFGHWIDYCPLRRRRLKTRKLPTTNTTELVVVNQMTNPTTGHAYKYRWGSSP